MRDRGLPTTGLASRVEDTVASGREAVAVLLDEAQPTGVRLRLRHPRDGRAAHPADRGLVAGRDVAVVGFDDSQVAQVVPPGLTSVRQPLEEVAVEIVKALEGLLGHPPAPSSDPACCSPRPWPCASPPDWRPTGSTCDGGRLRTPATRG